MQQLQKSERPHIAFFGCTNSGKSSLVNAITNQNLSIVSDVKGTTTDSVSKSMELLPLGPVVIIEKETIEKFKSLAEKEKRSASNLAAKLINDYVDKNKTIG